MPKYPISCPLENQRLEKDGPLFSSRSPKHGPISSMMKIPLRMNLKEALEPYAVGRRSTESLPTCGRIQRNCAHVRRLSRCSETNRRFCRLWASVELLP